MKPVLMDAMEMECVILGSAFVTKDLARGIGGIIVGLRCVIIRLVLRTTQHNTNIAHIAIVTDSAKGFKDDVIVMHNISTSSQSIIQKSKSLGMGMYPKARTTQEYRSHFMLNILIFIWTSAAARIVYSLSAHI